MMVAKRYGQLSCKHELKVQRGGVKRRGHAENLQGRWNGKQHCGETYNTEEGKGEEGREAEEMKRL